MLRSHWRKVGMLLFLTAVIVALTHAPIAAANLRGGGSPTVGPAEPGAYGAGGGSGGGVGCGDPDEFGIYSRPAPQSPKMPGVSGAALATSPAESRQVQDPRVRAYLFLLRVFGGVVR